MTSNEKKQAIPIKFLLLAFLLPLVLLAGRQLITGRTLWYLRVADLLDMVVLAPLYLVILLSLWFYMLRYGAPHRLLALFIVFAFVFIYGHAMHVTANAINTYSTEIKAYKDVLPPDVYALIFFLDERLSHLILSVGSIGLMASWLGFDQMVRQRPLLPRNQFVLWGMGAIYGTVQTYSFVEAQMVGWVGVVVGVLTAVVLWYWRRSKLTLWSFLFQRPYTTFLVAMILFFLLTTIGYGLFFNGFPQPSELNW